MRGAGKNGEKRDIVDVFPQPLPSPEYRGQAGQTPRVFCHKSRSLRLPSATFACSSVRMTAFIPRGSTRFILIALCPLLVLLAISHSVWNSGHDCYLFWREWGNSHPAIFTTLWKSVTNWGNALAYVVYAMILLWAIRKNSRDDLRLVLCYIAVQLVVTLLLTHVLKNLFGMPRPYTGEHLPQPWSFQAAYQSFPSGHTSEIVGAFLPLAVWRNRVGDAVLCGLWIAMVAYSRVYLGRHYLMDIWGGMAVGSLAALCILYFARKRS